jgi:superfamily II DNA/RNA helicase
MNGRLRNLMAQMESWEAANEFGIPEVSWADYDARRRSDDLYISCLSNVFDSLRVADAGTRLAELDALAKTLVIYSRSAAIRHLTGIERGLNQLYSAALYYMADRPATAQFLTRSLSFGDTAIEEEIFLRDFLGHRLDGTNELTTTLRQFMESGRPAILQALTETLAERERLGLLEEPRKFIAARFGAFALRRFAETNVWHNLQRHAASADPEIWRAFFFNARSFPMWELLPSQITALHSGMLNAEERAISLQMPTSAGKTSLCELLIFHEVRVRQRKVLFLVPFRALAAEIATGMSGRLEACGVNIIASYGGNLPTRSETTTVETADVLIVTPEKFAALGQVIPTLEHEFQTVICDEGHLIDDDSRGLSYELLLTKLRSNGNVGDRRIIFMSAILPNVAEIHAWLGGNQTGLARSDYKPVETDYAFLAVDGHNRWTLEVNPFLPQPRSYFLKDFLQSDDFRFRNSDTGRLNLIGNWKSLASLACAAALRARRHGAVAIFTTTKGDRGVAGVVSKLLDFCESEAAVAHNPPSLPVEAELVQDYAAFLLGANYSLTRLLGHGAGFHHGSLPQEIRRTMEESIANGTINILVCTSTLAEGVNLPIRTLIVHTFRRYNQNTENYEFIPRRSIKNIIGRVGRAGKETRGRIVFANEGERDVVIAVIRDQGLEPARGRLFRLIEAIEQHFRRHNVQLTNEVLERQQPWFLELLDDIDQSIINLVPEETSNEQIAAFIDEVLERTLAAHQSQNAEIKRTLTTVFRLRAQRLQQNIPRESWPVLKKSGASPRLWKSIEENQLLEIPLWQTLHDPLDPAWMDQFLGSILELIGQDAESAERLKRVVKGWLSGLTYAEIAEDIQQDVDSVLAIMCDEVGFQLQDVAARVCQLALAKFSDDQISEVAQAWPSFLQFGLGNLQQLDLCERGATDRLGVWGIQRFLDTKDIQLRGRDLLRYLRQEAAAVRQGLVVDDRVPQLCVQRTCGELRIR